ncbi:class F sortase [Streptosporangium becharense]|uniref:class F sortase n=1 Tax=Streptosporangium becharense TaxID=1816182 RepID=UPI00288C46FD|nr:class F sortase [Streptosporangium becharense]
MTALGLGAALLLSLSGCARSVGRQADPRLARALPVVAPVPPRPAGAPAATGRPAGAAAATGRASGETTGPATGTAGAAGRATAGTAGAGRSAGSATAGGQERNGWPSPLGRPPGRSEPVAIVVPRAGVNAPVMPVGSELDGKVEVPPLHRANLAGWDRMGPAPGENGAAVVIGHLDTKTGPAVFARLSQVRRGDTVAVLREDETVVVFRVSAVQQVRKTAFPVKKVYRSPPYPVIRVVTCGGRYDFERHSYDDNLIVYGDFAGLYRSFDFLPDGRDD